MPPPIPDSLGALLAAGSDTEAEPAWAAFLNDHSALLLHVARSLGGDDDAAMDRYAFMLDALRRDRFLRLRGYVADGRSQFSTWLIVVARRLCLDQYRQRYGRPQGKGREAVERHRDRRQLTELLGDELGLEELKASALGSPDAQLERADRTGRIRQALSRISPEDRLILRLRFEEGLSVPEVARTLHTGSPFSLYRRIDRVLATLRSYLRSLGIDDAAD